MRARHFSGCKLRDVMTDKRLQELRTGKCAARSVACVFRACLAEARVWMERTQMSASAPPGLTARQPSHGVDERRLVDQTGIEPVTS